MYSTILRTLQLLLPVLFTLQLNAQYKAVDTIFSEWNHPDTPGCALGIYKDGKLAYAKGYGMANLEYDISIDQNSVFRIGSTSKQFTAACIVLLAQEGKLSLDNTLDQYFPEFPTYASKITLRHLLHHTSGLRDYPTLAELKGLSDDHFYTDKDIMRWLIQQQNLNFEPGEEFLYCNTGYWLLGKIVEIINGENIADYAKEKIFEPLRMENTHYHNDHTHIVKNRADGYIPNSKGSYSISMTNLEMIGDGGIFTTINDFLRWNNAYYNREVLGDSFWEVMTRKGILNNGDTLEYAAGLEVKSYRGLKTISHGGAFVGFRAEFVRFPEHNLGIAILANRGDANPDKKAYQVADLLLKDQFSEQPTASTQLETSNIPEARFQPEQVTGRYALKPGIQVQIEMINDTLFAYESKKDRRYALIRKEGNIFEAADNHSTPYYFEKLINGKASQFSKTDEGWYDVYNRINEDLSSEATVFKDLTGTYYSQELKVNYHITTNKDRYFIQIGDNTLPEPLIPYTSGKWAFDWNILDFSNNKEAVTGFILDGGRAKNLEFIKVSASSSDSSGTENRK